MATFTYEALDAGGKQKKGTIEAGTQAEAEQQLRGQGLFPTSPVREKKVKNKGDGAAKTKKKKKKKGGGLAFGGINAKQLTTFTRQLSTLQDAGLPLLRSLQILESQQKAGALKNTLLNVVEEVEGGSSLSDAMAKSPKAFDLLYTKMVAAGEVGGVLDVILQRLSEFMEKAQKLKAKIKSAMIYPVVVVAIAVLILTGIMVLIIPKFQEIFADFGVELPGITLWLVDTSAWVAGTKPTSPFPGFGAVIIVFSPFVLFIMWKLIRKAKPGRAATDWCLLKAPIFGPLIKKTAIARFTRTLGTLISAGVPILEAIIITAETSGNWVFERALKKTHDSIREGETFAQPLRESKTCDALVVNMIDVGEETGDMDVMLMKVADNYDEEVDVAVAGLVQLIEPLMVVVLGGMVGTIVVAMFMPMVAMIESLQGGV